LLIRARPEFAIRQIRAVLEDERDRPQFLETVPKRGYRFIAPVERTSEGDALLPPQDRKWDTRGYQGPTKRVDGGKGDGGLWQSPARCF